MLGPHRLPRELREDGCAGVREGLAVRVVQLPFLVLGEVLGQLILGSIL